jgi:hypothetical protein
MAAGLLVAAAGYLIGQLPERLAARRAAAAPRAARLRLQEAIA